MQRERARASEPRERSAPSPAVARASACRGVRGAKPLGSEDHCRSPFTSTITPPHRSIRASSRRCCRTSPRSSGIPRAASTRSGGTPTRRSSRARGEVASLIGATAGEIVFTSGATESNNLAIKGAAYACRERGNHVITVATEHKSVLDSFKRLEREGWRVTWLGVDRDGFVRLDELRAAMTDQTVLVSVMAANNEIGVLQPLAEIGAITGAAGALLHTDAAQAAGKVPLDVNAMGIDLLSLTGHKYYGPKGAGALYIRRKKPRIQLTCQIDGGGHEHGLRSGTLNVPGIVGLGRAAAICRSEMATESARLGALRDRLLEGLRHATRRRSRQWLARASSAA